MTYRPEIDGLRAIAVIPVILFHAGIGGFSGGFVGVDVFLVISGYLITTIILTEQKRNAFSLVTFYERRARRILPALFFVVLFSIICAWLWLPPEDLKSFAASLRAVTTFSSNILFFKTGGYFDAAAELKPLLHTWSLAVEEQYYVIFPIFIVLTWKLGRNVVVGLLLFCAVTSLLIAQWGGEYYARAVFYLLPTRVWELLIGAFVAYYLIDKKEQKSNQWLSLIGLIMILFSIVGYSEETPFPSVYALVPTLGAALVILFSGSTTLTYKILSHKALVGIGLVSYSAYLWHHPLFSFARHRSFTEPSALLMMSLTVVTIAFAYLTWRYIEAPFRDRKLFGARKIFLFSAVFSIFIYSVGFLGAKIDMDPYRYKSSDIRIYKETKLPDHYWSNCISTMMVKHPNEVCLSGSSNKTTVLFGDSHAATIGKALLDQMPNDESLYVASVAGCPPIVGFISSVNKSSICSDSSKNMLEYIKSSNNITSVVLSAQWALYATGHRFENSLGGNEKGAPIYYFFENGAKGRNSDKRINDVLNGYLKTINELILAGKNVVLVDQVPVPGWDIPKRFLMLSKYGYDETDNSSYSFPLEAYVNRNELLNRLYSIESDKFRVVETSRLFCSQENGLCNTIQYPDLYFLDDNHLSYSGAALVSKEIFKELDQLSMQQH